MLACERNSPAQDQRRYDGKIELFHPMKAKTEARDRLNTLRGGLLRLHLTLLDGAKAAYERDVQKITSTGQYFNLVLSDPWFAWLRELSQLIALVDETITLDEPPATLVDAERLIGQARKMISPSEEGQGFPRKYWDAMQDEPDVVLAHRDMMLVFAGLATAG